MFFQLKNRKIMLELRLQSGFLSNEFSGRKGKHNGKRANNYRKKFMDFPVLCLFSL